MNENNTKKLSLEPYKGTRDFYPQDQFAQNYIFSVWKKVAESYGYLEYNASILEETELYKAKSGEEIVSEQTYSFVDRGGREVTIRPEMTPTVARMVAQKRKELAFPLRWFSIPNLFRYERPQRGRLREHWQLNVDIFGVDSVAADIEVVSVANGIMKAFGAQETQYEIRVNSRKFLNFLFNDFLQLTAEQSHKLAKLVDRMHKISGDEFLAQLQEIVNDSTKASVVIAVSRARTLGELPESIRAHESIIELENFIQSLRAAGISNARFEMSVVRGFDYYTGIVFEVFDTNPANPRSVFGGGRYDDLVGIFGVEKVPGIGFGAGDVTIRDFLETYSLLPEYTPTVDLYIAPFEEIYINDANKLAQSLREQGLRVAVDLTSRKVASKVKTADKEKIPWVVVVGEEEIKSDFYKLKNFAESKEYSVASKDISALVKREIK
jgi:histidyl-tRNA synthetase